MADEDKQPATDPNDGQAKPAPESDGAPETKTDDFEAALNEYDAATKSTEQTSDKKAEADETAERLKRVETELAQRTYQEDIGRVIKTVRGDFTSDEVDDEFIDTWLNAEAKKEPRLAAAWANRHNDPRKFEKVCAGLQTKFAERYAKQLHKRDDDATANREAVAHSVRSKGKAPEGKAPDYGQLTNDEFRKKVKEEFGFTPGV